MRSCRMCHASPLVPYLDLGTCPPSDQFLSPDRLDQPDTHYPLRVALCGKCGLSQLDYVVPPEILYCDEYP